MNHHKPSQLHSLPLNTEINMLKTMKCNFTVHYRTGTSHPCFCNVNNGTPNIILYIKTAFALHLGHRSTVNK